MTKFKTAPTFALAALVLVSAIQASPPAQKPTGPVEVRGTVVGPDGKPVAGANVRAVVNRASTAETTGGPDGRFRFLVSPTDPRNWPVSVDQPWIVASAPGFGAGLVRRAFEPGPSGELTIRLLEEGPAIEGRIVDLEGRPLIGASVKTEFLWVAEDGKFDAWLAQVRDQQIQMPTQGGLFAFPAPIEGKTGPDGRFRLVGYGPDRVATLLVSGPAIATTYAQVALRDMAEITSALPPPLPGVRINPAVTHGPKFTLAVAPTKPLEGVVLDKDTGKPIAGLTVQARVFDNRVMGRLEYSATARTDAEGRYRLVGLRGAETYQVSIQPFSNSGLPYADATWNIPAVSPALEPVKFDFALKRGVVVRGRVTDKSTGKPVEGYVHAGTFQDNPLLAEYTGSTMGAPAPIFLDADGRYQLVAIPGRNLIACRSDVERYRVGVGAEAIAGYNPKIRNALLTIPRRISPVSFHTIGEIILDPGAESETFDLQVDPGRSLTVTLLDPEDRPIGGTVAKGVGDLFPFTNYPQESSTFEIHALDPSRPRRVTVIHKARALAATAYLKGDESGPIVLRLQPWGTVLGRVVDDEGRPRKGLSLISLGGTQPRDLESRGLLPVSDSNDNIITIGSDGKFRVAGLVPGVKYGGSFLQGNTEVGYAFDGLVVAPGEVKDLGDVKARTR